MLTAMSLALTFPAVAHADAVDSAVAAARGSALTNLAELEATANSAASRLASARALSHSSLGHLTGICSSAGEVVGYGPDVASIFVAFKKSPAHWPLIVAKTWTAVGTGIARDAAGTVYVSIVFCQEWNPSSPPPAPAPPPPPPPASPPPVPAPTTQTTVVTWPEFNESYYEDFELNVVIGASWGIPVEEWIDPLGPVVN